VYARYLVKYVQEMKREGITIDAFTVQNEPLNSRNTPSMQMLAAEQRDFVRDHVGPAFRAAGLSTRLLLFDVTEDEQRAGAVRVGVAETSGVAPNVAFLRPDGRIALIVANDSASARRVIVQHEGRYAAVQLDAGAVATLVW